MGCPVIEKNHEEHQNRNSSNRIETRFLPKRNEVNYGGGYVLRKRTEESDRKWS
jgi:hypothetical protein